MIFRSLMATSLILFLSACALSPQYVEIDPEITVNSQVSATQVVNVNIVDRRPQNQLGTRGGVYAETSYIYPSQPLAESLRPVAIEALQKLGLSTEGQSPVPIIVTLTIDELSYKVDESSVPKKVALNCRISAEVVKGSRTHRGNFNSAKVHSYLKLPAEEENRKIINEVLSETLSRVFNDQQVISFIQS